MRFWNAETGNRLSIIRKALQRMLADTFNRDILVLLLISIIIGSLVASSVSLAANAYFSKTLANLVGDYGEYDLLIQAREEMKDDTAQQVQKIIDDVFPGARLKEGPTISGKTNFFIALPNEYKVKKTYEDLGKTFGSIPGGAGVGVLTEPRLTIRGVPEGAKNKLMENVEQITGVKFAFHDGSSIGVVLQSLDKAAAVSDQIKNMMNQYQVIEISFPVGSEPANPIRLGESIAGEMASQLKLDYAQNVSIDGKNDDMTYMVSTMMELKRFLLAYASTITITQDTGVKLAKGDIVALQGASSSAPSVGAGVTKENILVQITAVQANGILEGTITQGDASQIANNQAYKVEQNTFTEYAGTVAARNPRQQLSGALTETSKFVGQVPGFAQDAQNMSGIAVSALDNYSGSMNAVNQLLANLQSAGNTIQNVTSGLSYLDTRSIENQLDNSSRAMGGLIGTLQVLRLINPEIGATVDNLSSTQNSLNSAKAGLAAIDNVAGQARQAKSTIDNIVQNGNSTVAALKSFDAAGARTNLTDMSSKLGMLQQLNIPLITAQLQYMAAATPNLKDEDISHSVKLLDKFIAGQAIPGERIQILTTSNISTDAALPIVVSKVGHNNVSLYSTSLGVIEPNARGQLYQVLSEVKAVLAGMTAIVFTIFVLILDHTAIMTYMRRKRLEKKVKAAGWRGLLFRLTAAFRNTERQYGMLIGAVLLTAMFILAKGGIPYLPWIGVPVFGALLGLIVSGYAEKISPVPTEELIAAEALGLSFDQIMREIVIPEGRPGILQKLNWRKVKFK
jgi:ABC-type amino acid transport system permease subunit